MAIIKHRPAIRVRCPLQVHPGSTFDVEVIVDAKREVPIDRLDATVLGEERCTVGSGKHQHTYRHGLLRLGAKLSGKRRLPQGRSVFPFQVTLPVGLPPSYGGNRAKADYSISVRASIPWWPDRKTDFALAVALPPVALPPAEPHVYSTRPRGPKAKEPHLECSLATVTVVPGGQLSGSVALANVQFNRYRTLKLSLLAREARRDTRGRQRGSVLDACRYSFELPIEGVADGEAIPFALKVPASVPASFESRLWTLSWALEVRAKIAWASDAQMSIPLAVVAKGSTARAAAARFAPATVGSERVRQVWSGVATQLGVQFDGACLQATRGPVQVRVSRDHRGGDGIFLVAQLSYPALHLQLDGGLASSFRRIIGGGVALGHEPWDQLHYLTGRDPEQIRALGTALLPQLAGQRVADFDDEQLQLEHRDAGQSAGPLLRLTTAALALAEAFGPARAQIPPPTPMRAALASWRRLAQRLGGPLETARMAVQGHFEGSAAQVFTEWNADGTALRTATTLRPGFPVDEPCRLRWAEGAFVAGDPQKLPGEARSWLPKVLEGALALTIDAQDLELSLPAPAHDTDRIWEHLHRLDRLASLLRSKAGPYR